MNEIKQSIKRLSTTLDKIVNQNIEFAILNSLKEKAAELEKETIGKDAKTLSKKTVKQILDKIEKGIEIDRKDRKELPFVMADELCSKALLLKCLPHVDISRERSLKRFILVFFMKYGQLDEDRKKIYCSIISKGLNVSSYKPKNEFMLKMKHYRRVLYEGKCTSNVSRMINRIGLEGLNNELNLPDVIRYSSLIVEATTVYFSEKLPLANKMKTLAELMELGENRNQFYRTFPKIADNLIKAVHNDKNGNQYKQDCIDIFYEEFGDPRIMGRSLVRWNEVSDESRRIFLSWLAEKDLKLFFEIIAKTAVDHMWSSRKKFWSSYLPYITNTWVLFGKSALEIAHRIDGKQMAYGKLRGGVANHSVFAFQIGKFVFIEWSHNGQLRVWNADDAPEIFGRLEFRKDDITSSKYYPIREWRHAGNTNNRWQFEVEFWIQQNCGISIYEE